VALGSKTSTRGRRREEGGYVVDATSGHYVGGDWEPCDESDLPTHREQALECLGYLAPTLGAELQYEG